MWLNRFALNIKIPWRKNNLSAIVLPGFIFIRLLLCSLAGNYDGTLNHLIKQHGKADNTSFLLTKLTYESDIPFNNDEFQYLTGLKIDTLITKQDVDQSYRQLLAKRRFSQITINAYDYKTGKHIHFKLHGNWIFKKLDCRGLWFGKQEYVGLYAQHPGDIFDTMLHEESVKAIQHALFNQGYFDGEVNDEIVYEKKRKTITVKIVINRKSRFSVRNIDFKIKTDPSLKKDDAFLMQSLKKELCVRFGSVLLNTIYMYSSSDKLVKKIRAFLKEKGFSRIRISMTKNIDKAKKAVALIFNIELNQKRVLRFKGNTVFTTQQINEEILGIDQPDWLFAPDIIAEQLRYEYYKKGYWAVVLHDKKIADIGYEFEIEEGKATYIDHIEIKDFTTDLPEPEVFFWHDLLSRRQFDQELLDEGIEKLKKHYYANGYWDFKVVEKRFIKNFDTGDYGIHLLVDKGVQRLFKGMSIEGFKELEDNNFFKKYQLSSDALYVPFNYDWLSEQRVFLISHFHSLNYWYVDVQPDLRIVDQRHSDIKKDYDKTESVIVVWKLRLGEQVKFGKIFLRGATHLPFKTILKEVGFKEGDHWNKERFDLARKKLKRLDVFKTVQIQPFQLAQNQGKKPILLTLVDDDPVELRLRLGYFLTSKNFVFKQQSTPKVGTSLIIRNPTNCADKLMLDADWTLFERKIDLCYQQPSFFHYSVMSKWKAYANKYIHPVRIGKSDSAYEAFQHGLLWGLSDEYKRDYHWGLSFGNEWIRTSRVRGFLNLDKTLIDYTTPYFFVEPSLIIDKLDDRVNTKRGSLSFISVKGMVPEDRGILTARLTAEQSVFYPICGNIIGAARLRGGYIFRRDFQHIMPIERFYLGGPYSVRGYEVDALPPLGVIEKTSDGTILREYTTNGEKTRSKQEDIVREYTIQGGSSMVNGNLELRFPIFKNFGAVLFQDIGVLSQSGMAGFKSVWYPASGFGLRYKTPIGSLRFDIGWKWKRRLEHDRSYAWYLTLGEAF
jgi:outer membrane protein insertion porin family